MKYYLHALKIIQTLKEELEERNTGCSLLCTS